MVIYPWYAPQYSFPNQRQSYFYLLYPNFVKKAFEIYTGHDKICIGWVISPYYYTWYLVFRTVRTDFFFFAWLLTLQSNLPHGRGLTLPPFSILKNMKGVKILNRLGFIVLLYPVVDLFPASQENAAFSVKKIIQTRRPFPVFQIN